MPRLTADLILQSPAFVNPVQERELDLRGYKIPAVENLGATQDQFDTIDFSDNEIKKLENFPKLLRLKTIFLNNNKIVRADDTLGEYLPNLDTLILTKNQVQNLHDLDALASLKKLRTLSLVGNAVTKKPHFREYVIHKLPWLKLLDYRKIRRQERENSAKLFGSSEGQKLKDDIAKDKAKAATFTPGEAKPKELTPAQIAKIKEAIANSSSLAEVTKLENALRTGEIEHLAIFQSTSAAPPAQANGGDAKDAAMETDNADNGDKGDAMETEDSLTESDIKGMKVTQLRAALEERGLDTSGLKAVLVKRLLDHIGA